MTAPYTDGYFYRYKSNYLLITNTQYDANDTL